MKQEIKKKKWSMDFFIVAGVMTGLMLPARLLFVQYVSDSTFGSLGLISAIAVIMIILVKKDKLGKFGVMFEREMHRLTSGKKRIFILCWMTMLTFYFAFSIYSIDQGNTIYFDEKERIKAIVSEKFHLNFEQPETIIDTLNPEQVVSGVPAYSDALLNDFGAIAITQAIMNDLSNGFLLHFHIVFLVEGIEILGVFTFYSIALRNKTKEVTVNE